jgi:hypothetical protein
MPRHLYAVPSKPIVCPILALAVKFICSPAPEADSDEPLRVFEKLGAEARFSEFMSKLKRDEKEELRNLGVEAEDVGKQSVLLII